MRENIRRNREIKTRSGIKKELKTTPGAENAADVENAIEVETAAVKPKMKKWKIILIIAAAVIIIPIASLAAYYFISTSTMNQKIDVSATQLDTDEPDPTSATTGPNATKIPDTSDQDIDNVKNVSLPPYVAPKIINILLLGLDTRDPNQFNGGRTDSMIILSLDSGGKVIKLTSIMRDTLVSIPGHDMNRINTVFEFCGPEVTMQTVQKYFGVKIDYYAVVNFWALADIINSVKGVQVNVKKAEISDLNKQLDEINKYSKLKSSPHVRSAGLQLLDGSQAVAYMRIRHVGEEDFERTARQRNVLDAISKKDLSLTDILGLVNIIPKYTRTDMNQVQMLAMAQTVFGLKGAPIEQLRLPVDKSYKMAKYHGMSILIVDFTKNAASLKAFLEGK